MAPKQAPSFDIAKGNVLNKLVNADKSPKGSLDAPIAKLIYSMNDHRDFVSTSCCSGRIVLFAAGVSPRNRGRWLLVRHDKVSPSELGDALASLGDVRTASLTSEDSKSVNTSAGASASALDGLVTFKLEPPIVHILCRDMDAAKSLLKVAVSAGFRESGISLSNTSKVMVAIRSTANSLELPVATGTLCDAPKIAPHLMQPADRPDSTSSS